MFYILPYGNIEKIMYLLLINNIYRFKEEENLKRTCFVKMSTLEESFNLVAFLHNQFIIDN